MKYDIRGSPLYNKRILKLAALGLGVVVMMNVAHFTMASYSEHYSKISSNVAGIISDYLVDPHSYLYREFAFQGEVPQNITVENWSAEVYEEALQSTGPEPGLKYQKWHENYQRRSDSALVVQVRNKDLAALLSTMKQLEDQFNKVFRYPYVIMNIDGKYSQNFKQQVKELIPDREVYFELINLAEIGRPAFIDKAAEQAGIRKLKKEGLVPAMNIRMLKNLFRYFSSQFYFHPRLQQYKYYWRFEPGTSYFNKIDYDVFAFMEDNKKTFGFTIAAYEYDPLTVETLFPTALKFLSEDDNMRYLHEKNSKGFLREDLMNPDKTLEARGYSTCHFWSSFEIANMDFFRGSAYQDFFSFLDESGGFYYDRWGDGPVHTMALSLFEDRDKIHWFKDIAYEQYPFTNCPASSEKCEHFKFSEPEFENLNCAPMWQEFAGV